MQYEKDAEILELKRRAKADYRQCGNELGLHPSACSQRCLGFIRWQLGERERLRKFLMQRIAIRQEPEMTAEK